ncbi:hypothetical protein [Gorillibacterium sp. CAU 1737]|uniref:hypothetical protein n=1 Tax=Gorillibacterium sp. CAU 1737 TaxID=3140362 RepID=UPI0032602D26
MWHRQKRTKVILIVILVLVIGQTSVLAYSQMDHPFGRLFSSRANTTSEQSNKDSRLAEAKTGDSGYDSFLTNLSVQKEFKNEIDRLLAVGYPKQDIFIAYDFLFQNYGLMNELEDLLQQKKAGKGWGQLFDAYLKSHPDFIPRSFDSQELEGYLEKDRLTSDDVMIADRISFVTQKPVKDIVERRLEAGNWSQVCVDENVIQNPVKLPRVQITTEQLDQFMKSSKLSEAEITKAFVLARKVAQPSESVVKLMGQGLSETAILAKLYPMKYQD